MDKLLEDIKRRAGLYEAIDYHGMFSDILSIDPRFKDGIDTSIVWARKTLRKNDRIVWFLRWVKLFYLQRVASVPNANPKFVEIFKKALERYNKQFHTYVGPSSVVEPQVLQRDLEHFLSYNIPAITNTVFLGQTPQDLFGQFRKIENQWREEQDNSIDMTDDEDAELVLQFPDGFAWWNLNRYSCRQEGDAMGHCGNTASGRDGETILSLRKKIEKGGQETWFPCATFILDENGMLGEMKGRGNEKPAKKYHPYIVALLRHHLIKGIKGGGYAPEQNFNLAHLEDDDEKQALLDEKPELADFEYWFKKEGWTKNTVGKLETALASHDFRPPMLKLNKDNREEWLRGRDEVTFTIQKWTNFENFINDIGDDAVEGLIKALDEANDIEPPTKHDLVDVALNLPEDYQRELIKRAKVKSTGRIRNDVRSAIEQLYNSGDEISDALKAAFQDPRIIKEQILERIGQYMADHWEFPVQNSWIDFTNLPGKRYEILSANEVEQMMESPIELRVAGDSMVTIASYTGDEESYDYEEFDPYKLRNDGWDSVDFERMGEHRNEEGLTNRNGKDKWLSGEADIGKSHEIDHHQIAQAVMSYLKNGRLPRQTSPKVNDPRQTEISFEMRELRRRAGILT
jgi:hypothetical protein